jgi:hypothetical protein
MMEKEGYRAIRNHATSLGEKRKGLFWIYGYEGGR